VNRLGSRVPLLYNCFVSFRITENAGEPFYERKLSNYSGGRGLALLIKERFALAQVSPGC